MKKIIILSIAVLISLSGFTQISESSDFSYSLGKTYKLIEAGQEVTPTLFARIPERFYFQKDDKIIAFKSNRSNIIIQSFDTAELKLLYSVEIKDLINSIYHNLENIVKINNRFCIFYSLYDKENKKEQLFYKEIDYLTGASIGEDKLLFDVSGKVAMKYSPNNLRRELKVNKFRFFFSADSSKILVQYIKKPEIKKDALSYDNIGLYVFDNKLEKIWNKEVKMPYTEKIMDNMTYSIDGSANAYILTLVRPENKKNNSKQNYHFEVLKVLPNSDKYISIIINPGNKFINSMKMLESPDNNIICAGFYSKNDDPSKGDFLVSETGYEKIFDNIDAKGVFVLRINKEGKLLDTASYEIPLEILNQNENQKQINKNNKKPDKAEIKNTELKSMFIEKDGSFIIIGESIYVTTSAKGNIFTHYDDILVAKIKADNKLAWMKKIPKKQTSSSYGNIGMSFNYFYKNNYYYFLFLDNEKNTDLDENTKPVEHSYYASGIFTAYNINNFSGETSRINVFNIENMKGTKIHTVCFDRAAYLSSGSLVFDTQKNEAKNNKNIPNDNILFKISAIK